MKPFIALVVWVGVVLSPCVGAKDVALEEKSPSQRRESLIWNVDREIHGFRVEVLEGNPIIQTIKFLPGREFTVGARFSKGNNWERRLETPVNVNQLRVNVDTAEGSRFRLVLLTDGTGASRPAAPAANILLKRPTQRRESLIWDVNEDVRGFEVFVREGRPIVNTVRLLGGGAEFTVGSYLESGRSFRHTFDRPTRIGQLRVNVDQAQGSALELKLYK